MRILVTGPSGNLGPPLVRALIAQTPHRLRLFGRNEPPLPPGERVQWVAGDLRNADDVRGAVSGVEAILHLAALTCSNRAADYDAVNVGGTRNVVEAAGAAGVPRLIHFSSWVASEEGGAYARSKLRAEEIVRASDGDWVILRPANLYGPGLGGSLSDLLARVRAGRPVPIPGHGRYAFSPLHVDDLVAVVLALLERPGLTRRIYTLTGPEILTVNEVVERAAVLHGVRPRKVRVPLLLVRLAALAAAAAGRDWPARDQVARLLVQRDADTAAARRDLGFDPRSLEDGLAAPAGR